MTLSHKCVIGNVKTHCNVYNVDSMSYQHHRLCDVDIIDDIMNESPWATLLNWAAVTINKTVDVKSLTWHYKNHEKVGLKISVFTQIWENWTVYISGKNWSSYVYWNWEKNLINSKRDSSKMPNLYYVVQQYYVVVNSRK